MTNTFKKSLLFIAACLMVISASAETMYVLSGKCNVPLTAGMNNAKTQFFKWDGSTATVTTAVTSNITSTAGFYYNSTSLAYADITDASKYSSSSTSARTMQGFKITGSETMTIGLGSIAVSKIIVGGRCASNDPCTLNIAGETVSTNNKNSFVKVVEGSFTNQIQIANSSGKEYNVIVFLVEGVAGPVAVTGVSLNKTTTSIVAGQMEQLTATVSPAGADDPSVTWSSDNTSVATVDQNGNVSALASGTATITVTTTDGNKTASCTVTVTAPPAPVEVNSISMKSTATIGIGASETLTVTYDPADANTSKALTWSSSDNSVATVDENGKVTGVAAGTATITATTANGKTATCTVTVQAVAVTGVSLSKHALSLQIGQSETLVATVAPATATNKNVTWTSSKNSVATVDANGKVTGVVAGTAVITVTTADGSKTDICSVDITAGPPVPATDLTTHVPEIYEAKDIAGGYNGTLAVFNSREYEVYYAGKTTDSYMTVDVKPCQKQPGITNTSSATACKAKDGWFEATGNSISNYSFPGIDEFAAGDGCMHKIYNNNAYKFHIQGYDQFSFYGKDNSTTIDPNNASKNKRFQVYIDNVLQPENPSSTASIRRYDISTGEHVIEVRGIGASNNEFYGWSLRVAQEPRTKWLKGNDSTQVVMQTAALRPITYVTKYNNIPGAQTRLIWDGAEATGIGMSIVEGTLTDTILVSGTANCATGVYNYAVVAYYNGIETSRATGKFTVKSDIQATSEINVDVYAGEEMDQITFKYFALSADDVQLTWDNNNQPTGVTGSGSNGKYIIGGTPTVTGTFPFDITVTGADTVIHGTITVNTLDYGDNAVLYLYKNYLAYEHDGVYQYIKGTHNWNLIARKQKEDGLRPADQYANYKWILISEDVDADNTEVLAVIRGDANLPVLNLKGFAYSSDRLGWGEPDNGAIDSTAQKSNGCKLYVQHPNHPIYTAKMNYLKTGDSIQVLSDYTVKGLMPINIDVPESYCLGTAYTRNIDDYYSRGEKQTALHEIPAAKHNGKKYICLPLAKEVTLASQGQQLIEGIIRYLMSADASGVTLPELKINTFSVAGVNAEIDQIENTILLSISEELYDSLKTAEPVITLADPNTHVNTSSTALEYAVYLPKTYVVTDYINRRAYSLTIEIYDPQGIDEVYEAGMWVNVFDIYGRKVTTTNEDIYMMDLPKGMYIIVTESGQTLKIMR